MQVDSKLIDKLAHLARLEFSNEEKHELQNDLRNILALVEKLQQVDTKNVEPLIFLSDTTNVLRKDVAAEPTPRQDALKNAPKHDSDFFKVPKVVTNNTAP